MEEQARAQLYDWESEDEYGMTKMFLENTAPKKWSTI